eukprot:GHVU01201914.1.p1 GENE.GHVU01201914.1~~GHVU01201914.1.p1  ORF type:complete len:123 (-),score=7.63 GHVU01201914.1:667-1035(-)
MHRHSSACIAIAMRWDSSRQSIISFQHQSSLLELKRSRVAIERHASSRHHQQPIMKIQLPTDPAAARTPAVFLSLMLWLQVSTIASQQWGCSQQFLFTSHYEAGTLRPRLRPGRRRWCGVRQ